jgi:hypothetical protein
MFILALIVHDGGMPFGTLMAEASLMALCGALPTVMIAIDRQEKNKLKIVKDFFVYFIAFFIGHLVLQYGGFYTHTFMKKPDET